MENESKLKVDTKLSSSRKNFGDIEHAIVKFADDCKTQDVGMFFWDFEEIMKLFGGDDTFKYLSLRRSLTGAARALLENSSAIDYESLKTELIAEFKDMMTRQDAYRLLKKRKWDQEAESRHHYVLLMQSIGKKV